MGPFFGIPLRIWIISLSLMIAPILTSTILEDEFRMIIDDKTGEMIWLVTLFPSIFFSYYKGLRGGLFVASIAILSNFLFTARDFVAQDGFVMHHLLIALLGFLLHLSLVISVGILAEKLKYKESELVRLNIELEKLSLIDELTGLTNRRGFLKGSEQAIMNHPHFNFACLFIDLDSFKPINDEFGHDIGDQLLKIIAKRLNNCVRETDIVGRLGGDEFVCLLRNANEKQTKQMVARILTTLSKPVSISGQQLFVTSSIGIAVYPLDGNNIDELLKSADNAMYKAKEFEENSFYFYEAEPDYLLTQ